MFITHAEKGNKGEWRRQKEEKQKQPRNFCIKFVAFCKRCQCCEGDSEQSHRSQGFGSEWITKSRRQDGCSATARFGSPIAAGMPLGVTWGKENKFHMLERGNFQIMVFLLLIPAERWLCTFPHSCCRLKVTPEATDDGVRCSRGVGDLYSLKSVVWSFQE